MACHSRHRSLRSAGIAVALLALTAGSAPAIAQQKLSIETLLYDLKSPDPTRRQVAVRELGIAKYRGAIPQLIPMVHDSSDSVRRELELSLERLDDVQAMPGFIALASDSESDIRARAVGSLVSMHLPHASGVGAMLTKLGELVTSSSDRDLDVVVDPEIHVDPVVIETLRARIGDSEHGIRRTAIRGLGILRGRVALPDLLQVVREDRDDGLRFEAARSIRKIGDASVAGSLVALLNINADTVRNELIETLGSMRDHGAVAELTRIVAAAQRPDRPCILAMAALADIADPASVGLFDRYKADKNEMLRLYANEGIARTANVEQKTAISAARLIEKSPRVRTAQAFALLRIGEGEYMDELIRGLERSTTRDLAREYLLETRPSDRQALFAPRPVSSSVRADLADLFGQMGDPEALPRLQEMARDADGNVKKAAERAARRLATGAGTQ